MFYYYLMAQFSFQQAIHLIYVFLEFKNLSFLYTLYTLTIILLLVNEAIILSKMPKLQNKIIRTISQ